MSKDEDFDGSFPGKFITPVPLKTWAEGNAAVNFESYLWLFFPIYSLLFFEAMFLIFHKKKHYQLDMYVCLYILKW